MSLPKDNSWFVDEPATFTFVPSFSTGDVALHSHWDSGFANKREWRQWKRLFRKWRRELRKMEKKK